MGSQIADPTMHVTALQHFEAGRLTEAGAACEVILHRSPSDWLALRLLGHVRNNQHAFDQAARLFTAALQAAPPNVPDEIGILHGLAEALRGKQDFDGALDCYRRALARNPRDVVTLQNHGSTLIALNRHAEALEQYRLALAEAPDALDLRVNEGVAMLAMGMWPEGWERLEARLSLPLPNRVDRFPEDVPHWRGETDIAGRSILLQAEQGLGDTLQFIRYAPLVAALGARVVVRVQPALGPLLTRLPIADAVLTFADAVPDVDVQCPIMSLPLAFRTTLASVPAQRPYIGASPEYLMLWQALLGLRQRGRIGVAWFGRQNRSQRSMPLHALAPLLLARRDLEFHSLQKEMPDADRHWLATHRAMVDHSTDQKNFADTAALVAQMDVVLSIDTSLAHLAGALGKPVWIMLPFSADWRWLVGRTDTPWYPTARLFRQGRPGDWEGVVAEVAQALSV
jgi:tetratricopeptide (TPR) repeat protein